VGYKAKSDFGTVKKFDVAFPLIPAFSLGRRRNFVTISEK